jgi:hypothetical protein
MPFVEADHNRRFQAATMQDNWLSQQALGALLQEERVGRNERAWLGQLLNTTLGLLMEKSRMYVRSILLIAY